MKNFLNIFGSGSKLFLLLIIALLFVAPVQAATTMIQGGEFDFLDYVGTFELTVAATLLVSNQVIDYFNIVDFPAQLISWTTGVLICFAAWFANIGFISDYTEWYQVLLQGVGVALVANGVFDVPFVRAILNVLSLSKNKERLKTT